MSRAHKLFKPLCGSHCQLDGLHPGLFKYDMFGLCRGCMHDAWHSSVVNVCYILLHTPGMSYTDTKVYLL